MSDWSTFTRLRVTNNDPTLTALSLSVYTLTPAIAEVLRRNTTISSLSILDGHLPLDSVRILATKTNLTCLNIWIGPNTQSLSSLHEVPRWTTLKILRFRNTSRLMNKEDFENNTLPIICQSQHLEELHVEQLLPKKIGKMMLESMGVKRLDLSGDQMFPELCAPLAAKATLRSLELYRCKVGGAAGLKALAESPTIQKLRLSDIFDADGAAVCEYLKRNHSLTNLSLQVYRYSAETVPELVDDGVAHQLTQHTGIRTLAVNTNNTHSLLYAFSRVNTPPQLKSLTLEQTKAPGEGYPYVLLATLPVLWLSLNGLSNANCMSHLQKNTSITWLSVSALDKHLVGEHEEYPPQLMKFSGHLSMTNAESPETTGGKVFPHAERLQLQQARRKTWLTVLAALSRARASGLRSSPLLRLPIDLLTLVVSSIPEQHLGVPRWVHEQVARFFWAQAEEIHRRQKRPYPRALILVTSNTDNPANEFTGVKWEQP